MAVITLCGSRKFKVQFQQVVVALTKCGHVVLTPVFETGTALTVADLVAFRAVHQQRIAMADAILVVDVGGHVGRQTTAEIAYARQLRRPVTYYSQLTAAQVASGDFLTGV